MNYQRIYDSLCQRAKNELEQRVLNKKNKTIYYERHHVIPRCIGGSGECSEFKWHPNIVTLTAKEHYMAHRLLCLIYPDNKNLQFALWRMLCRGRKYQERYIPSGKIYEKLRIEYCKINGDRTRGKTLEELLGKERASEERIKRRNAMLGNIPWNKGKKTPQEVLDKISAKLKGRIFTKKHKENISLGLMGHKFSDATKLKLSIKAKNRPKIKYKFRKCPHCNHEFPINVIQRWHLDNCRYKK